jgi:D-aminopeptidase
MFVPEIETVAVKRGLGEEAAEHRDRTEVLEEIRERAARAVERAGEIPPLDGVEPPYVLEIRRREPIDEIPDGYDGPSIDAERVDGRTIRVESEEFTDVYP